MTSRLTTCLALIGLVLAANSVEAGEPFVTENFVVYAPTDQLAQTFGEFAERYRKEKAIEWLGNEMPRWRTRCPLEVKIKMNSTGGATRFTFSYGANRESYVVKQDMEIWGETQQLLYSVLPHEVTHTVLAYHYGEAVPRWADEGGSVLSENDEERYKHDIHCRELLNQGRGIQLGSLFKMREYPDDMIVVYAQGYSICQYLISQEGGRDKFLRFVGLGMKNNNNNWEQAVRLYNFESTSDLQEAWIKSLRNPPDRIAARNPPPNHRGQPATALASRTPSGQTRTSALVALPQLDEPTVVRGSAPSDDRRTFGDIHPELLPPELSRR